jgi:hypothetical protein
VSNKTKGIIIFLTTPLVRKAHKTWNGYYQVRIGNKSMNDIRQARVHREVGLIYVYNPDWLTKDEVNHMNGDKSCNEWWNFEWVTRQESIDHAFSTGLIKPAVGEDQSNTKLKNEQVLFIYNSKEQQKVLCELFGVSTHTIHDIKRGRTWWHITGHKRHIKPSEKGKYKKQ